MSVEAQPLVARAVAAAYDEGAVTRSVLAGVDLTVSAGELVAVLGPNGAGKTTLLRVLSGALPPRSGEVRVFGERIETIDRRALARRIAVVAQDEPPAFGWTVEQIVMMGRAPHQGAWLRASDEDAAIVEGALARCDLLPLAKRVVSTLSGGERKRVTIARALAQRTPILLLDEPSAFLDVRHQVALYELLAKEVAAERRACVVVVHDFNVAARYAGRVALAKGGRLVDVGRADDVLTPSRLAEVFETRLVAGTLEGGRRVLVPA